MTTAILIVDMQNDFKKIITADIIKQITKVVQYAHLVKIPVFWIKSRYDNFVNTTNTTNTTNTKINRSLFDDADQEDTREQVSNETRLKGTHTGKKMCEVGTYGAEIIDEFIGLISDNNIITKAHYSSFIETNLDRLLKDSNITNLIICGVTINTCVIATTIDAKELGYNTTILSNCVCAFSPAKYKFGLDTIKTYADVVTSENITNGFESYGTGDSFILYDILPSDIYYSDTFNKLIEELDWKNMSIKDSVLSRLICVQADETLRGLPIYRNPSDTYTKAVDFTDTIRKMINCLNSKLNLKHKLNHVFVKYYKNGSEGIGKHSDKTLDILPGSHIVNLSLGATRYMTLTKKGSSNIKEKIKLTSNSAFLIGMETNKKFYHEVKPDKRPIKEKQPDELIYNEGRMSLTFRSIGTFVQDDKLVGQGAPDYVYPTINDANELTIAFGEENSDPNFDWLEYYGKGFYAFANS